MKWWLLFFFFALFNDGRKKSRKKEKKELNCINKLFTKKIEEIDRSNRFQKILRTSNKKRQKKNSRKDCSLVLQQEKETEKEKTEKIRSSLDSFST
jgi:hypothetical protein